MDDLREKRDRLPPIFSLCYNVARGQSQRDIRQERKPVIIILEPHVTPDQRAELEADLKARGYGIHLSEGVERTIVGVIGTPERDKEGLKEHFEALPYVERVVPILKPYKIVGKSFKPEGTVIHVRGVQIGGGSLCIMAGPCTV